MSTPAWVRAATIAGVVLVAALLLLIQSLWRGHIGRVAEYDDGVYFGAALEVAKGILPYRSFDFLQPPLITVWLLPFAVVAAQTSQRLGFELARWFTDLVTVADVVLVGVIMQGTSTARIALAMAVTALSVGFLQASQTILLEPYLVFWCLLGLVALGRRSRGVLDGQILAGVCFGLAGATKVWAVFPAVVIFAVLLSSHRRSAYRFALATGLAFTVAIVPFVAADPAGAFRQVLLAQAQRGFSGESFAGRLSSLSGFAVLSRLARTEPVAVVGVIVIAAGAALLFWRRGALLGGVASASELARISRWSALVIGLALLAAPEFYYHYAAFFAPFLGLAVGTAQVPGRLAHRRSIAVVALVAVIALLGDVQAAISPPISGPAPVSSPLVQGASACAVSDQPAVLILSNSFTGAKGACPHVVDWLGTERVLVHGTSGTLTDSRSRVFQATVRRWVAKAQVVVLSSIDGGLGPSAYVLLRSRFRAIWEPSLGATLYRRLPGGRG
ncbi:MAG: glycosyltransferase 87 family protein [Actinomycetota bacterium]|nr:glycosyltransferase 87 family protein [Actinomycetota bacterium]